MSRSLRLLVVLLGHRLRRRLAHRWERVVLVEPLTQSVELNVLGLERSGCGHVVSPLSTDHDPTPRGKARVSVPPVSTETSTELHGGRLIARCLKAHGVSKLFTLSGGHLFSIYDGCRAEGIDLIDVRHEQTAGFAAEGWAKVTRTPGVCALTAGPGVTNGMSAIASAAQNNSPVLVLAGRAPQFRWGQGSLQEIDHVPFVRPLVKLAATPGATSEIAGLVDEAMRAAVGPHSGPGVRRLPTRSGVHGGGRGRAASRRCPSPGAGPARTHARSSARSRSCARPNDR